MGQVPVREPAAITQRCCPLVSYEDSFGSVDSDIWKQRLFFFDRRTPRHQVVVGAQSTHLCFRTRERKAGTFVCR